MSFGRPASARATIAPAACSSGYSARFFQYLGLGRAGRIEAGIDGIDGERLGEDRDAGIFGRGRIDMAAGGEHERDGLANQRVGDRPDPFAALEVNVDDGDLETALLDPGERAGDGVRRPDHVMPHRFQKILEHHRDQRLVLDDQNGSAPGHGARLSR